MNRMKHLMTAVVTVIVVVTGLSLTAAVLRHRANAGSDGEAGGHRHGSGGGGMEVSGDHPADPADGPDQHGHQHGQTMEHGEEAAPMKEAQPDGHAHTHGGAEPAMKHGDDKPMTPPTTAPSAADMLEPLLSSTKPADGASRSESKPAPQQEGHQHH